ncbi:MAG: SAM-dependent chlorinase/fluorinase [Anaerolineae bacterium]|nr:SAM-dependent chlorinase/fluorinase [Anaerolineae bacterium]
MPIITLTTDFGLSDGYVGIMKGVILGICPQATLVDLTHEIPPQNVRQAAYVLKAATPYYPPGTIHVVVVDPGVGGARRPLAIQTPNALFIGPDNGVFTPILLQETLYRKPPAIVHLDQPRYWLATVSHTFHGRDIFAPVAAHLANGVSLSALGTQITDAVVLNVPRPARQPGGSIAGEVIYVDRFGNLITNIPAAWLPPEGKWVFEIRQKRINGLSPNYAAVPTGSLLAIVSSEETLEIAQREGSAARSLGTGAGEPVIAFRVSG